MVSRTEVITKPPLVAHLKARASQKKLAAVLIELKEACKNLPVPFHNTISQQLCQLEGRYPSCKNEFQRGFALCFLNFNIVENVLLFIAVTREEQVRWVKAWKELNAILEIESYPSEFIENYKQRQSDLIELPAKIAQIKQIFQRFDEELYSQADTMYQFFTQAFEKCKEDFKQALEDNQKAKVPPRAAIDALTAQVKQLYLQFQMSLQELQDVEEKVQAALMPENLTDLEKLLNKV